MPNAKFYLHHYPRQEVLADWLIQKLQQEGSGDPFYKSHVLVRNQGMATWLSRRLAEQSGLAMQVDFPQPNSFLQKIIGSQSVDPEDLKWQIYQTLPHLLDRHNFQDIKDYLSPSKNAQASEADLKRYQLSGMIAGLFDKYLLYRPDWIAAWQNNDKPRFLSPSPHESWQRELWLELQHNADSHWSQTLLSNESLELPDSTVQALHVFGISNFAPIYVRFLYQLSQQIPVHIYWMNPVEAHEGYWEDSPSRHQWTMAKEFDDPETLNHHNALLASFGRLGREFVHTIYGGNLTNYEVQAEAFMPPSPVIDAPKTRLEYLQSSIYNNSPNKDKQICDDSSISIHACHTPLRELETLRDYLLTIAEKQPLEASEVLVMCPDIESYAPAIEAVFGGEKQGDSRNYLPFSIGDSHAPAQEPSIAAALKLFSLHTIRFTNHEALALLSTPAIRDHFNLSEEDLTTLREWIIKNGIRWGFDAAHVHHIAATCPETPWTWRDGINRMLLGFAIPNQPQTNNEPSIWRGILPFNDIEGGNTRILGALCDFIDWCDQIKNGLSQPRTLSDWVTQTRIWIDMGFNKDADSQQCLQPLYQTLDSTLKQADHIREKIPVDVFSEHLTNQLENQHTARGFLNGSVTFCEMKPMRAIPASVICLLGMNHDTFPRKSPEVQFDLTQQDRQIGDRSTRDDDTYSFLEALLSARSSLFISYMGTSIKDGKERPPSTALQTLLDYEPSLKDCVKKEKLHSFDPHYFQQDHPISHDHALLSTAQILQTLQTRPTKSITTPDFELDDLPDIDSIDATAWISALTHPARYFLKQRLQARTIYKDAPLDDNEAIEIAGLQGYQIKSHILDKRHLSQLQIQAWKQDGTIPVGEIGNKALREKFGALEKEIKTIPETTLMQIAITIRGLTITGNIPIGEMDGEKFVIVIDASDGKPAKQFTAWAYQLLASAQLNTPIASVLYGLNKNKLTQKKHIPCVDFIDQLSQLVELYQAALIRPLPHFPRCAEAYTSKKPGKNEDEKAHQLSKRNAAQGKWESSKYSRGESEDEAIQNLFDVSNLLTDEFISISETIWLPILDHRQTASKTASKTSR